jgi:hypothetical protein
VTELRFDLDPAVVSPASDHLRYMQGIVEQLAQYLDAPAETKTMILEAHAHSARSVQAATAVDPLLRPHTRPPDTPERDVLRACAWADHRAEYGVSGDPKVRLLEYKAFKAGFEAAYEEQRSAQR